MTPRNDDTDTTEPAPPPPSLREAARSRPDIQGDPNMSLAVIRSHLQTAGDHVGDMLWWVLEDARITRTRLESIWSSAGLSLHHLPEPPTPEKTLRLAVREAATGQASHLIRLAKETEHEIVFAVVEERRDGSGNLNYAQEARVTLDRNAPSQLHSDNPTHDLVATIRTTYDQLLHTHTADDVRRAIIKVLGTCAALTLREHGGVYWVPAPSAATLRQLQAAIAQIGHSRLDVVPIHATPEAQHALGDAARSALEEDVATLRVEIDGFLQNPPERTSTLVRRLQTFDDLRAKARLYHSILSIQIGDLEISLNDLTRHVESLIVQPD